MINTKELQPPFVEDFQREIAHIYDLLRSICTFKKVQFTSSDDWSQSSNGYYKLQLPCTEYVALAAFEDVEGGTDKRANCTVDVNSKYVTVTATAPFDGYIVAADVNCDEDDLLVNDIDSIDTKLSTSSVNAVSNSAITIAINALIDEIASVKEIAEKAVDTAKEYTTVPDSLPASDVYPWAKAKSKPIYTWDEICGKPKIVEKITYFGKVVPNYNGEVKLDEIADIIMPTKLSQLAKDISLFDLVDGDELKDTLDSLSATDRALKTSLELVISENAEAIEKFQKNIDAYDAKVNSTIKTFEEDAEELKEEVETELSNCKASCSSKIEDLRSAIDAIKAESRSADTELASGLKTLAARCREEHEEIESDIDALRNAISNIDGTSSSKSIASLTQKLNALTASLTSLEDTVKTNKELSEAADDVLTDEIVSLKSSISKDKEDISDIKSSIEDIPNNISELVKKVAANGIKVEESEINGNVIVKTPVTDENGAVVTDESGNTTYTSEEVKVYSLAVPDDTDTEAKAVWDSLVTEEELSSTIAAMTSTAKVSAIINYDENNGDQYINISESSGLIWVNGQRVTLNVTKVETSVNELKETVAAQAEEIAELKATVAELWKFIGGADENSNETYDDGEDTLGDAVTDGDSMTNEEVTELFNDPE